MYLHTTLGNKQACSKNLKQIKWQKSLSLFCHLMPTVPERQKTRVSKFSKNLFRENFEAHSKIIYFREISTIFIIIFAKFSNRFSRKFSNKFSRKWKFSRKCSAPVAHISSRYSGCTQLKISEFSADPCKKSSIQIIINHQRWSLFLYCTAIEHK